MIKAELKSKPVQLMIQEVYLGNRYNFHSGVAFSQRAFNFNTGYITVATSLSKNSSLAFLFFFFES